jgi:nicotinamidase/pyrazinamidase
VDALLIIDFQNDFTPGGALAVTGGDEIAEPLAPLLDRFDVVVATRDWHPPDHSSFAGTWPVHCVQGTDGAELHPGLDRSKVDVVVDKGQDALSEGYSAFQDTELADLLRSRGVDRLYVAGLATDYCVKNTVLDALQAGFEVTVVEDAIRGVEVEPGDSQRALEEMRRAGAVLATTADVVAATL